MLLGVLIFIDDYFNCLTVGAVMRPVTESHKISRAKLAYIIDATAAPVCMLAPVSSWAAAVASYVPDGFPGSRISMFLSQIPFNYYCILTLVMVIVTSVLNIDYGPMLTHEYNAQVKDDLFTTPERPFAGADDYEEGEKHSSVLDLLVPVIVLIALCIVGLIWTGGMWDTESENYGNFIMSFSDATAGTGLCLGSIIAIVFTFVYYWCRGLIGFNKSMEAIPNGFIQMISPILILCFAWTLCGLCRDNGLQVGSFVEGVMANTGSLAKFLPAVIFIVACFIGFATGTSWGTIGIMVPLVCAVFNWDTQMTLLSVGLAASCAGGVCGDHLSPISDTTIMASAGAHCFHLNHVATQLPYGITVAAVSFVSFIIAGLAMRMPYRAQGVSKRLRILFPIIVSVIAGLVAPSSVALVGFLMFGNLIRECGVLTTLSKTAQNELANLITLLLGITISFSMKADQFVKPETLLIMVLGLVAFVLDSVVGVLFVKVLNLFTPKNKINPMVGAAGISAFPMSSRVIEKLGQEADPQNHLLMHAVAANVSGQIASVVAGGVILQYCATHMIG